MKAWIGLVASLFIAAAGALWHLSGETADTKRRVETVEKRQVEDRETIRRDQHEIKTDVKEIKDAVQKILIRQESQEAARSVRERSGR
jgi:hypothetical protein